MADKLFTLHIVILNHPAALPDAAEQPLVTGRNGSNPETVLISYPTKPIAPMPWSQIRRAKYQCTTYDDGNNREKRAVTQKADRRDFGQDYEAASISHQDNEQCKSDDVREEQRRNCKPNGVGDGLAFNQPSERTD
jgi:hypothetical protein